MSLSTGLYRLITARANPRLAAILRITVGIATTLVLLEEVAPLIRLTDPAVLRIPYLTGLALPPALFVAIAVTWLVGAAAFTAGLTTRLAGTATATAMGAAMAADQQLYSNHLYLAFLLVILLTVADAGAVLSLDGRRDGSARRPNVPGWPIVLIGLQVSLVYGFAALAKLNPGYLSGSVLASYLRRDGPLALPAAWAAFQPMLVLSITGALTEAFLAVTLWIPRWRPTAFVVGLALHAGIAIWLVPTDQLLIFGALTLPLYLVFLDVAPRSRAVVWDDSCDFCRGSVRLMQRLDWLQTLVLVPASDASAREGLGVSEAEALEAVQLVGADGRRAAGFRAISRIAAVLPISFLWAALLRLPPVAAAGDRVYRRIAASRSCNVSGGPVHAHRTAHGDP